MKRCFLHVGHPKNASTYLQTALHLNAKELTDAGFWVPSDFTRFGSYDLANLAANGAVFSGNMQPAFEAYYAHQHDLINEIFHYIFFNGAKNIILSSELLFYYNYVVGDIGRRAEQAGYEFSVVAYLSRQDRAVIASYLQNIRNHDFYGDVLDFLNSVRREAAFRYYDVFQSYGLEAPNRVIARTFEPSFLIDGDILADFLSVCSCPVDVASLQRPTGYVNSSLPLEWCEILRGLNRLGAPAAKLLSSSHVSLDAKDRRRLFDYYFRSEIRDYIIKEFLPNNDNLIAAYLPTASTEEKKYWTTIPLCPSSEMLNADKLAECLGRWVEITLSL